MQAVNIADVASPYGSVSISLGVHTCLPAAEAGTAQLSCIEAADQLPYPAKINGRNCMAMCVDRGAA